ncbi:MAG: putative sulfate exporter family transporter, partial [Candidatus Bathyarchaeota archaeon]
RVGEDMPIDWSSLWKKGDWWAVWIGLFILALAVLGAIPFTPKISSWQLIGDIPASLSQMPYIILLGLCLLLITGIATRFMEGRIKNYLLGFPIVFLISIFAYIIANQQIIKDSGLAYALWALVLGLILSNTLKIPKWLSSAAKTELFIKIGLVLLGAEILFSIIVSAGVRSIFEVTVGLALVWYLAYFLAVKLGLKKSFAAIMANATSVCGVSAAIAAGGAVKGDPKEISHVVSLVLLFSGPMIILMPLIAKALQLSDIVAGAWIGGTIDNTASVVASGALFSEEAMQIASVVKMSQNILIGITAFLLAMYWVFRVEKKTTSERPKLREIWYRFPKFIIGFMIASVIFSLVLVPMIGQTEVKSILGITKGFRGWFFALTFVSIGLNTKFKELVRIGRGRPLVVFLTATLWDIVVSLISAYIFFGGILLPPPV